MNICIFTGRTTKDIDLRYSKDNNAVANFSIANDTGFGDNKKTSFLNMVAFGKTAESLAKYATKGTKLILHCTANQNQYTNKDGNKINEIQFVVSNYEFAESKKATTDNGSLPPMPSTGNDFMSIPDGIEEELPFQ